MGISKQETFLKWAFINAALFSRALGFSMSHGKGLDPDHRCHLPGECGSSWDLFKILWDLLHVDYDDLIIRMFQREQTPLVVPVPRSASTA